MNYCLFVGLKCFSKTVFNYFNIKIKTKKRNIGFQMSKLIYLIYFVLNRSSNFVGYVNA